MIREAWRFYVLLAALGIVFFIFVAYDCGAHANARPVPPDEATSDARLALARAMVAEAGWVAERDHAAIAHVLARRWRREHLRYPDLTFRRMVELYCAAWNGKPTARQRWVRELAPTLERPRTFPRGLSWERHRPAWEAALQRSDAFFAGELADPCDGRAVHWGGEMDEAPEHWRKVDCGATANRFYTVR